jgi:hypothetical protein
MAESFMFENKEAEQLDYEGFREIIKDTTEKIHNCPKGIDACEFEQQKIAELIEELLSEKEKFNKIFKTKNGSIYFVLDSGESFRIKNDALPGEKTNYLINPFCSKIFFVPEKEFEKISKIISDNWEVYTRLLGTPFTDADRNFLDRRKKICEEITGTEINDHELRSIEFCRTGLSRLIGEPIITTSLQDGVIPIEIGFAEDRQYTNPIFKLDGGILTLMGCQDITASGKITKDPASIGAYHYGHPVSEVIHSR